MCDRTTQTVRKQFSCHTKLKHCYIFQGNLLLATLVNPYNSGFFITVRQMCGNLISWIFCLEYQSPYCLVFSSPYGTNISSSGQLDSNVIAYYLYSFLRRMEFVRNRLSPYYTPQTAVCFGGPKIHTFYPI